ncbi:hypothetical protein H6F93_15545 [Leptolyngbya sp. FACHB-671]|uniref:hypothetical protein n=1 Tax=Leptolyngbya sp. FACHB-671 TaxID=2692812 RepID=UPI0016849FFB|nr:hypothetical protein [Leptolyngbya sp. FACHB-671]MBD2068918.1 hypothetical protein [Leptolyngbya sp. FACHB-671]
MGSAYLSATVPPVIRHRSATGVILDGAVNEAVNETVSGFAGSDRLFNHLSAIAPNSLLLLLQPQKIGSQQNM